MPPKKADLPEIPEKPIFKEHNNSKCNAMIGFLYIFENHCQFIYCSSKISNIIDGFVKLGFTLEHSPAIVRFLHHPTFQIFEGPAYKNPYGTIQTLFDMLEMQTGERLSIQLNNESIYDIHGIENVHN